MAEKFDRSKQHYNISTFGHVAHGKTTLTAAITKYCALSGRGEYVSYEEVSKPSANQGSARSNMQKNRIVTISTSHVEYETENRHYAHVDCPGHADYVKNMITGAAQVDGGILVISAVDGVMPQTREHIILARQVNVPNLVVFLNMCDIQEDPEMLDLIEMEIQELLDQYKFDSETTSIIRGAAFPALQADSIDAPEMQCIKELLDAVDKLPQPVHDTEKPFMLPIENVYSIPGRGTVVTGRVERGKLKIGDKVEIVGIRETQMSVATGLEQFHKQCDELLPGDNAGVLLRGIKYEDVERGQVLAIPGTLTPHKKFEAEIYVLTEKEGGRHKPFFAGYTPQFFFSTSDITGKISLKEGTEMILPGDNTQLIAELYAPVALEVGTRFAVREGGRTIGAGAITAILE